MPTQLAPRIDDIARRIDAEFTEMPGERLTTAQVRRLWNASQEECEAALASLCASGRLVRDKHGRYVRPESRC